MLTKCRVGQSTGALTVGVELSSVRLHCAFMKRAGPMNYVKQGETPLSYVLCAAQPVLSVLIQDYH